MQIYDKDGLLVCPNPIELIIEDVSRFTIIDNNCEQIYKSTTKSPTKCGEYIILHVIDPKSNSESCEEIVIPTPVCDRELVFNANPAKTKVNGKTEFEVFVSGNQNTLVYFKTDIVDWTPATIGQNGIRIQTNSTGLCESIWCKLDGCDSVWGCFLSFAPDTCTDTTWTATVNTKCENNISYIEFESNCGNKEFRIGGTACGCVDTTWELTTTFQCIGGKKQYLELSNCDNARWAAVSTENCTIDENEENIVDLLLPYPIETQNDRISFNSISTFNKQSGFTYVLGNGAPLYSDFVDINGKLPQLAKGWDHISNINKLPYTRWATYRDNDWFPDASYYFQQGTQLIAHACSFIKNRPEAYQYGAIERQSENPLRFCAGITLEGWKEIGKEIGRNAAASLDPRTNSWDWNSNKAYLMFDEEANKDEVSGIYIELMKNLLTGFSETAPMTPIMVYGIPVTWFIHQNPYASQLTPTQIENAIKTTSPYIYHQNIKAAYDISLGYFKTPGIQSVSKYEKNFDGSYQLGNNRRIYKTSNNTESYFGGLLSVPVLGKPTMPLRTYIEKDDGSKWFVNTPQDLANPTSKVIGDEINGYSITPQAQSEGWHFHPDISQPYPENWISDYEYSVFQVYRKANALLFHTLVLTKAEFNDFDITKVRPRNITLGTVNRKETEEWTKYGNTNTIREIGDQLLIWDWLFGQMTGLETFEVWNNGTTTNSYVTQGTPLFGTSMNYTSYLVINNTIRLFHDALDGTSKADWKFVRFYYPFIGEKNSEIIATGIYVNSKLILHMYNPSLDYNESCNVVLQAGNYSIELELLGSENFFKEITVPTGLNVQDFTIDYVNIVGKRIKVTGLVNEKVSDHYIFGLN